MAEITHADNNNTVAAVHTQDAPNLTAQFINIISIALLAEFSEAAQVLTDLGGRDAHFFPKCAGRNTDGTLQMQVVQVAVITGKAANDGVGYILLFHMSLLPPILLFRSFYYIVNQLSIAASVRFCAFFVAIWPNPGCGRQLCATLS